MFTKASKLRAQQTRIDRAEHRYMDVIESLVRDNEIFLAYLTTRGNYYVFSYAHCDSSTEHLKFMDQLHAHMKNGTLHRVDQFDGKDLILIYERKCD